MINELANKDLFYKEDKLFKKHFSEKKKTKKEQNAEKQLSSLVLSFYQKVYDKETQKINYSMFDLAFCTYGYLEDYGYYAISYDDNNHYCVEHYDGIHDAFISIARKILSHKFYSCEKKSKSDLKNDFKTRFGNVRYFDDIYRYEYELDKWNKYFDGNIPNDLITMYNNYINSCYHAIAQKINLKYDETTQKIIMTDESKSKKLTK